MLVLGDDTPSLRLGAFSSRIAVYHGVLRRDRKRAALQADTDPCADEARAVLVEGRDRYHRARKVVCGRGQEVC